MVERVLIAALLLVVVGSNLESLVGHRTALPYPLAGPVFALNLQQRWEIFTRIDGIRQGLLTGEPAQRIERPEDPSAMFDNHNDRRYWTQLSLERNRALRPMLAAYLCRRWRAERGSELKRVAAFRVATRPAEADSRPRMLVKRTCPKR